MDSVILVILLALVQYAWFGMRVGAARAKYGIAAPSCTGNDVFERTFRVHQNTLEQLMLFVPGMLAVAHYIAPVWALGLGVVYLVGRQMYAHGYVANPKKRGPGAGLSMTACYLLVLGGLAGVIWRIWSGA